jgi:Spy/CpxP family protein refolding chaperone
MSKTAAIGYLIVFATTFARADQPSPYLGQQQRELKALSPQDVEQYLEGKGMGFAKAAELNHFPGPLHVIELADKLQLTLQQKTQSEKIYSAMQRDARTLGAALVDKERELDRLFSSGEIASVKLRLLIGEIGRLQANVRNAHLQAHLEQKAILTQAQVAAYDELRGYASQDASSHLHRSHNH